MARVFDSVDADWLPVRPDVASKVLGATLLRQGVTMQLVRVAPGGGFAPHRDSYGHLFYFLAGEGTMTVADQEYLARPGLVAEVAPGELHAYTNSGSDELRLISVNIPLPGR
jgi:quercetin dioxygenase-like cupin family protein